MMILVEVKKEDDMNAVRMRRGVYTKAGERGGVMFDAQQVIQQVMESWNRKIVRGICLLSIRL